MGRLATSLFVLGFSASCVSAGSRPGTPGAYPTFPSTAGAPDQEDHQVRDRRARVAQEAARLVGQAEVRHPSHRVADDCAGLVRAAYMPTGVDPFSAHAREGASGVERLYAYARQRGALHHAVRPHVGDLAFFHDTYDRNGDGQHNDPLTHVAVVERVDPDGTVVLVHRVEQGVVRQRMNLLHPGARRDPRTGKTWNHFLRRGEHGVPARTSGELFAGFATLHVDTSTQVLAAR
jgi:hypothetical protein